MSAHDFMEAVEWLKQTIGIIAKRHDPALAIDATLTALLDVASESRDGKIMATAMQLAAKHLSELASIHLQELTRQLAE